MAKVFVSFLGTGAPNKPVDEPAYSKARYNWPEMLEQEPVEVHFAQSAILKCLEKYAGGQAVDRAIFLCTEESETRHLDQLEEELTQTLTVVPPYTVPRPLVPKEMTAANQWGWFEQLLENIENEDTLIIDFTHGFRSVPIVLSSAVGFLRRAKNITLQHALYGWYDNNDPEKVHPIVDMRDFYVIDDWAESISRLADDADIRKLELLAQTTGVEDLRPLAEKTLITAFQEMTDCIRNVDVNNVSTKIGTALEQVEKSRDRVSGSAAVMLDLVRDKFCSLTADYPAIGNYDRAYFESQLCIIEVLLEHRLFMQAFTAMRELVGAVGMVGLSGKYKKKMSGADGRKYRRRFAEVFVNMMQNNQDDWKFSKQAATDKDMLMPWFITLKEMGVERQLRNFVKPLVDIRNGFDHAWTAKAGACSDIEKTGKEHLFMLRNVINRLSESNLLP